MTTILEQENKPKCDMGYSSPRWTSEIIDCSLPVTFDTYNKCSFKCVYCFSQYQRGIGAAAENYYENDVKSVNPQRVKDMFLGKRPSQFWEFIMTKRPIQWGGLSDQFDGYEKRYGVTYDLLKFFKEINYPICFSTKSTWVFEDPLYQDLFRGQSNWNMKFSIITLDEEKARKIEVGVPSPKKRLEAMRRWVELNPKGGATLRLRPFIIGVSDKDYEELIRQAAAAGATAVSTEFFCLEMRANKRTRENYNIISDCCGFDLVKFYKRYSSGSGYLRLNRKIKEPYIRRMKELCDELGLRFYVSDAHFKEMCTNSCCCGLPDTWEYSRGNFSAALQIAKKNGKVYFSDIEKDMYFLQFQWGKADGFNTRSVENRAKYDGLTMADYMRYLWNTPSSASSPYKLFERVLTPCGNDERGDIIYLYNSQVSILPKGCIRRGKK